MRCGARGLDRLGGPRGSARLGAVALGRGSLGRAAKLEIELAEFTKSRFSRRYNSMDEDRIKCYNWNLACIILTAIPPLWMYTVN